MKRAGLREQDGFDMVTLSTLYPYLLQRLYLPRCGDSLPQGGGHPRVSAVLRGRGCVQGTWCVLNTNGPTEPHLRFPSQTLPLGSCPDLPLVGMAGLCPNWRAAHARRPGTAGLLQPHLTLRSVTPMASCRRDYTHWIRLPWTRRAKRSLSPTPWATHVGSCSILLWGNV